MIVEGEYFVFLSYDSEGNMRVQKALSGGSFETLCAYGRYKYRWCDESYNFERELLVYISVEHVPKYNV